MDDILKEVNIAQNHFLNLLRKWNDVGKDINPELNQKITDKLNELDDLYKEQSAAADRTVS